MVYKRYLKKSETDDDAVPPEVTEEDARLNSAEEAEEAEDQDSDSDSVRGKNPTSSQGILAQKLHDYIGSKLPAGTSPEKHAAVIRAVLSTRVVDPVSGNWTQKYINKDMRELFEQHRKNSHTYTPTEMIGPTTSLAIMRMRLLDPEDDHVRALEHEDVQPEETEQPNDEAEDVWRSLGKNTHNLDIMVKSLLRKIANGEI